MSELEDRLREELRRRTPENLGTAPMESIRARAERNHRARATATALSAVAAIVVASVAIVGLTRSDESTTTGVASDPSQSSRHTESANKSGTLTKCVDSRPYPEGLEKQSIALDATIVSKSRDGSSATFDVNRWFRGGTGKTVTLPLTDTVPERDTRRSADPAHPIGQRLLISGRTSPDAGLSVWQCGFTRPWTDLDRDLWARRFGEPSTDREPDAPESARPGDLDAALRSAGEAFIEFARGGEAPPSAVAVDLLVGGERVKVLSGTELAEPSAWSGCPSAGGYAERTCPFSATEPIATYDGPLSTTSEAPEHPCLGAYTAEPDIARLRSVTLTPQDPLDCTGYFAVQLFFDDDDQLAAVNVVWAAP